MASDAGVRLALPPARWSECERVSSAAGSFGHDFTPEQHTKTKGTLIELLKTCEYKNPRVDVLGQGQLLGLITLFPSLALELLGRGGLPFQSFDGWKVRDDMTLPLHVAAAQSEVIATIQKALQGSHYQHIRMIGEPGIGKTRLVLEALSVEDLAPMVIYSPHAEDFQRNPLFWGRGQPMGTAWIATSLPMRACRLALSWSVSPSVCCNKTRTARSIIKS